MNFGQHCVKNLFHYQKMSLNTKKKIFLETALNFASKIRIKFFMNFGQHCVKNLFYYQKMSKIQKNNIFGISIKFCILKSNKSFHEFWSTLLEKFISTSKNVQKNKK